MYRIIYIYTWGALHGEARNSSFSSRKNEVQYCCCAAPGMQKLRPTPNKNAESRTPAIDSKTAALRNVGVSNDPSKGAKQIPCKLQERPRPGTLAAPRNLGNTRKSCEGLAAPWRPAITMGGPAHPVWTL